MKKQIELKWWMILMLVVLAMGIGFKIRGEREVIKYKDVIKEVPVEVKVVKEVPVEEIVYRDTEETLEYVAQLEQGMDLITASYVKVYEVAEIAMYDYGYIIDPEHKDMYQFAKNWSSK